MIEGCNIAINTKREGYPMPAESDHGWGGGSDKWEIVDGKRTYPGEWAHGLAFTGGRMNWAGEPCGVRQATIDFGDVKTFYKAIVWHHGLMHIPKECKLQYWNDSKWIDITSNRKVNLEGDYGTWSAPDTHIFTPVTASKIRCIIDNCKESIDAGVMEHGWIYEFEVYEAFFSQLIAGLPIIDVEGIGEKFAAKLENQGIETINDLAMMDLKNIPALYKDASVPLRTLYVAKRRAEIALSVKIDPALMPLLDTTLGNIMKTPVQQLSDQTNLPIDVIYGLLDNISTLLCTLDNRVVLEMTLDKVIMY